MITLYGFKRVLDLVVGHTRDMRAQWALEEAELDYRVEGLDFNAGDLKKAEFRRLNPFAQVPVLEDDDDGMILTESGAIVMHIADKSEKLMPTDAAGRAQVTRWCFAALNTLEPPILTLALLDFGESSSSSSKKKNGEKRTQFKETAERHLKALNAWLAKTEYVAGPSFSAADILMTHVVREARNIDNLLVDLPNIRTYLERCESRPAWKRMVEKYEDRMGVLHGTVK